MEEPPSYYPRFSETARLMHPPPVGNSYYFNEYLRAPTGETASSRPVCGTVYITVGVIIFVVLEALSGGTVVVGVQFFLNNCPDGIWIPCYMITAGCLGCFRGLVGLIHLVRKILRGNSAERAREPTNVEPITLIIDVILFFGGCVFAIFIQSNNSSDEGSYYCSNTLYQFELWSAAGMCFVLLARVACVLLCVCE